MRALSEFFLRSGFEQRSRLREMDGMSLDELQRAIREAIEGGDLFSEDRLEEMFDQLAGMSPEQYQQLVDRLTQKLADDGYVSIGQPGEADERRAEMSQAGAADGSEPSEVRFELSDKSLDFLGYKAFKDLLGSLGKSSLGSHDTREMATGVETSGSSKQYQFGDTLNLDVSGTLSNAIQRQGMAAMGPEGALVRVLRPHGAPIRVPEPCATVLMLDCSHSMILYGEDRFTPAKQVGWRWRT